MGEYLIRLPWPPSERSSNGSQGNFFSKQAAGKAYKKVCTKEMWAQAIRPMQADTACVEITFHAPTNGRYDLDNALGKAKHGLDAVAEVVGIDDANWSPITLKKGPKVKNGCVMVLISTEEGGVTEIPVRGQVT